MKRPQFSLRTLMIAATVAGLLLAATLPFVVAAYKRWTASPAPAGPTVDDYRNYKHCQYVGPAHRHDARQCYGAKKSHN